MIAEDSRRLPMSGRVQALTPIRCSVRGRTSMDIHQPAACYILIYLHFLSISRRRGRCAQPPRLPNNVRIGTSSANISRRISADFALARCGSARTAADIGAPKLVQLRTWTRVFDVLDRESSYCCGHWQLKSRITADIASISVARYRIIVSLRIIQCAGRSMMGSKLVSQQTLPGLDSPLTGDVSNDRNTMLHSFFALEPKRTDPIEYKAGGVEISFRVLIGNRDHK